MRGRTPKTLILFVMNFELEKNCIYVDLEVKNILLDNISSITCDYFCRFSRSAGTSTTSFNKICFVLDFDDIDNNTKEEIIKFINLI